MTAQVAAFFIQKKQNDFFFPLGISISISIRRSRMIFFKAVLAQEGQRDQIQHDIVF